MKKTPAGVVAGRVLAALLGRVALACLLLPAMVARCFAADDWPAQFHDVQRSNRTDAPLAFPLGPAWEYRGAPAAPAWTAYGEHLNRLDFDYAAHPVVADGRVFIASSADDCIRCLDLESGRQLWRFTAGGPVRFAPQIEAGRCYAAADDGRVYCLDAASGALLWRFTAAPAAEMLAGNGRMISRWPCRSGILVENGVAYAVAGMWPSEGVYVYALDAGSGRQLWVNDTGGLLQMSFGGIWRPHDGHAGEFSAHGLTPQGLLLASEKILLLPLGNNSPAHLDKATGGVRSFTGRGSGGGWFSMDRGDAERIYYFSNPRDSKRGRTLVLTAGRPLNAAHTRKQVAFPLAEVPLQAVLREWKYAAVAANGRVYAKRAYGLILTANALIAGEENRVAVYALPPDANAARQDFDAPPEMVDTGKLELLWQAPVQGRAYGLAAAGGRLIVSTDRGSLHVFATGIAESANPAVFSPPAAPEPEAAAETLLAQLRAAGADSGFALLFGDPDAHLATHLAGRGGFKCIIPLADEAAAAALRNRLLDTTPYYGGGIQVVAVESLARLPFAQFFASAIVVAGDIPELAGPELYRLLRPCGGVLLFSGPGQNRATALLAGAGARPGEVRDGLLVRGPLPGARDWDNPAPDQRLKWPLRPLWFGGPELDKLAFHEIGLHPPVAANGRYFVTGEDTLTAVDAYTGLSLWTRPIPSVAPHVRQNHNWRQPTQDAPKDRGQRRSQRKGDLLRQLCADAGHVYLELNRGYWQDAGPGLISLDARNGAQTAIFAPFKRGPIVDAAMAPAWELIADGKPLGRLTMAVTAAGLEFHLVTTDAKLAEHDELDIFLDLRPAERRCGLYEEGVFQTVIELPVPALRPASSRPGATGHGGFRQPQPVISGDGSATGADVKAVFPWAELEALCGGRRPTDAGFAATLNSWDGDGPVRQTHLFGDRMAPWINNGWAEVTLAAAPPAQIPAPAVLRGKFTEAPPAWRDRRQLDPGAIAPELAGQPRLHPFTAEPGPRVFRSGTGACGAPVFSAHTRFGRTIKEALGIYDFEDDSGLRFFGGVAANCGGGSKDINMTAALGVFIFSDARVHCYCVTPFRTSFALAPAERRLHEDWAFFNERNPDRPLARANLNLGAPGDRRDAEGRLWLTFPGQSWARRAPRGVAFPLRPGAAFEMVYKAPPQTATIRVPLTLEGFGKNSPRVVAANADRVAVAGTDRPWLYTSLVSGISRAVLDLNLPKPLLSQPATGLVPQAAGSDARGWLLDGAPAGLPAEPQARLPYTQTDIFVCHDERAIYLLARRPPRRGNNRDGSTPANQWRIQTAGEDAPVWQDDAVEFFMADPTGATVMHLGISASGARYDALAAPGQPAADPAWNGTWRSAVRAEAAGFQAEAAIPWEMLEKAGLRRDQLAINVQVAMADLSGAAPTYPPQGAAEKRMDDPHAVLAEPLLSLGPAGRKRCANFARLGITAPPPLPQSGWKLRLHFAELDAAAAPGRRVFDIKIQGQTVENGLDIAAKAGPRTALVREFAGIRATDSIEIQFVPAGNPADPAAAPILNALELLPE